MSKEPHNNRPPHSPKSTSQTAHARSSAETASQVVSNSARQFVTVRTADLESNDDFSRVKTVLCEAFFTDPILSYLLRNDSKKAEALDIFFDYCLGVHARTNGVALITSDGSGSVVWLQPGAHRDALSLSQSLRTFKRILKVCTTRRVIRLLAYLYVISRHQPRNTEFVYMFFIGVKPAFQGKGIGSILMSAAMDRIEATSREAYLETSSEDHARLYNRFGFHIRERFFLPFGGPEIITMLRSEEDQ